MRAFASIFRLLQTMKWNSLILGGLLAEAASPSHAEAEMSSPFVDASSSIFTSGFLTEDSALEPQAPALHLQYDSGAPRQQQATAGEDQSNGNDTQPSLEVAVQPLQLMHRSACFARLQGLLSDMPQDLHSDRVLHAINQIASPAGRALAKAELALIAGPPLWLHLEVRLHKLLALHCSAISFF